MYNYSFFIRLNIHNLLLLNSYELFFSYTVVVYALFTNIQNCNLYRCFHDVKWLSHSHLFRDATLKRTTFQY